MSCISCSSSDRDSDFVFETESWKVFLLENQYYLGRCVVVLKRHSESLSGLKQKEWNDFAEIVNKLESALKKAFGAAMFNWTCMMNDAYKTEKPNPHIHWHLRPRYKNKIEFACLVFEDTEFGNHYDRNKTKKVSGEIQKRIIEEIRKNLQAGEQV